jgi:hypothetical protein
VIAPEQAICYYIAIGIKLNLMNPQSVINSLGLSLKTKETLRSELGISKDTFSKVCKLANKHLPSFSGDYPKEQPNWSQAKDEHKYVFVKQRSPLTQYQQWVITMMIADFKGVSKTFVDHLFTHCSTELEQKYSKDSFQKWQIQNAREEAVTEMKLVKVLSD